MFKLFPQLNELNLFQILPKETIILLGSILRWICSDSQPEHFIENGKMFFYFSKTYFSSSPFFSKPTLLKGFKTLVKSNFISEVKIKTGKRYYYAFNWDLISTFIENESWSDFIIEIKEQEMNGLFDIDEINLENKINKYPKQAVEIVEDVLDSFSLFITKKNPKTKTFQNAVKFVADLHAGIVTNPRIYPIKDEREEFEINGWKEKLESVKLNWNKIKRLIFTCIENYQFMFQEDFMPYNKKHLPISLDKYFYDSMYKESYFIRCLNKPVETKKFLSEKKADNIFEILPPSVQQAGEELLDLNPSMSSGIYWEKIKEIFDWSTCLKKHDVKVGYWFNHPSDLIYKYCDFLKKNKIKVAINTLDITKVDSGSTPWKRFLQNAILEHDLNPKLIICADPDDICNLYELNEDDVVF